MTDFANDPLWEEETKEPELIKTPPQEQPDVIAAAGNAATARAISEPLTPEPMLAKPEPLMAAKKQDSPKTETIKAELTKDSVVPETNHPEQEEILDWRSPLHAVLKSMNGGPLDQTLPIFLAAAAQIPNAQVAMAAGLIISAFLRLPLGARQPVREVLIANLSDWPSLPIAQLILIRLGGLPVAPPPPAPPGDA